MSEATQQSQHLTSATFSCFVSSQAPYIRKGQLRCGGLGNQEKIGRGLPGPPGQVGPHPHPQASGSTELADEQR